MGGEAKKESINQQHLRVVGEIAAILEKEFTDTDDIYFIIRTLRNIFLYQEEEDRIQWLFTRALSSFAKSTENREWLKK